MRDPGGVLAANELFAFFAQTGQGRAHAMHLPPGDPDQITDRGALRPASQASRWACRELNACSSPSSEDLRV